MLIFEFVDGDGCGVGFGCIMTAPAVYRFAIFMLRNALSSEPCGIGRLDLRKFLFDIDKGFGCAARTCY